VRGRDNDGEGVVDGIQVPARRRGDRKPRAAVARELPRGDLAGRGADGRAAWRTANGRIDGTDGFVCMHAGPPSTCKASTDITPRPRWARFTVAEPLMVCRPSPLHASTARRSQNVVVVLTNEFILETRCLAGPRVTNGC